jgi:hypothetical protein
MPLDIRLMSLLFLARLGWGGKSYGHVTAGWGKTEAPATSNALSPQGRIAEAEEAWVAGLHLRK